MQALLGLLLLAFVLSVEFGAPEWFSGLIWISFLAIIGLGVLVYILNRFSLFRRVRFIDDELNKRYRWGLSRLWKRSRQYTLSSRPGSFKARLREWGLQLVVIALFPLVFIVVIASLDVENDWISLVMLLGAPAVGLALLFRLLTASQRARRHRQQLTAPEAGKVLAEDPRPPVLLLRAFRMDEADSDAAIPGDIPLTFEEFIVRPLKLYGPVVAIGRPDETLPPLGAHREYVSNDWQGRVKELLNLAQIIVVILDDTPGLKWELEQLFEKGLRKKVLMIVPAENQDGLRTLGWAAIDHSLEWRKSPSMKSVNILALVFDSDGEPQYITGPSRNAEYFLDAVRLGSRYINYQATSA
ncbi:MAG: hypothetical protein OQL20_00380 [Sedimenticola sp.]|nr:hypothetical protein [Sedimenticola sp.]